MGSVCADDTPFRSIGPPDQAGDRRRRQHARYGLGRYDRAVVYPGRATLRMLPEFEGSAGIRQTSEQRAALLAFVAKEYTADRSIHELAELIGRTHTAVRRALDQAGVVRRQRGAPPLSP